MKHIPRLLLIVLLSGFSSCVSFENLTIEVLKPAKFSIPADIRKVALVSRNLKYENDTFQYYQVKNQALIKDKIRFNSDSAAQITCMDTIAAKLLIHNRFDSVMILPVNTFPVAHVQKIMLDKAEWYKNLTSQTGADGLIILDMFSCFYKLGYDYNSAPRANVVTSNVWSVYDSKQQKIIDRFVQVDTLYWDGKDDNGNFKQSRIPAKKEAIKLAAGVIGENFSKHILPTWTMVYRDIMVCDRPGFKQAAKLA